MNEVESGKDKIQKICDVIKKETLDPARQQAKEIIDNAHIEAKEIIKKAKEERERLLKLAKKEIDKERKVFDSSLYIASKQAFEELKQKIENELFSKNLEEIIKNQSADPQIVAKIINVVVETIQKEGLDADISAYIANRIKPAEINEYLIGNIVEKLKEKEILIGDFEGGAKIKMHNNQITIDLSDEALKQLVAGYIRADFREKIFNI